jgi:hypothetical protein
MKQCFNCGRDLTDFDANFDELGKMDIFKIAKVEYCLKCKRWMEKKAFHKFVESVVFSKTYVCKDHKFCSFYKGDFYPFRCRISEHYLDEIFEKESIFDSESLFYYFRPIKDIKKKIGELKSAESCTYFEPNLLFKFKDWVTHLNGNKIWRYFYNFLGFFGCGLTGWGIGSLSSDLFIGTDEIFPKESLLIPIGICLSVLFFFIAHSLYNHEYDRLDEINLKEDKREREINRNLKQFISHGNNCTVEDEVEEENRKIEEKDKARAMELKPKKVSLSPKDSVEILDRNKLMTDWKQWNDLKGFAEKIQEVLLPNINLTLLSDDAIKKAIYEYEKSKELDSETIMIPDSPIETTKGEELEFDENAQKEFIRLSLQKLDTQNKIKHQKLEDILEDYDKDEYEYFKKIEDSEREKRYKKNEENYKRVIGELPLKE